MNAPSPQEQSQLGPPSPPPTACKKKHEDFIYYNEFNTTVQNLINDKLHHMPMRLIDTYLGVIREGWQISHEFRKREDYQDAFDKAFTEYDDANLKTIIDKYFQFAMLSHCCGDDEPTLKAVKAVPSIYSMEPSSTVVKLQEFCCTAAKCGYQWAWSDTCCIDKDSSADCSMSINSMFTWYRNSSLTIVYLHDVTDVPSCHRLDQMSQAPWFEQPEIKNARHEQPSPPTTRPFASTAPASSSDSLFATQTAPGSASTSASADTLYVFLTKTGKLPRSKEPDTQVNSGDLKRYLKSRFPGPQYDITPEWCIEGWTLQGMLASRCLRFYSEAWTLLERADDATEEDSLPEDNFVAVRKPTLRDHRQDLMWQDVLSTATGVPKEAIVNFSHGKYSVRDRLHWASNRYTEKVEDNAYCLLGLFDLNMPIIYGEGKKAFARLQEEIMKRSDDLSLFDWSGRPSDLNSCLASAPSCFSEPSLRPVSKDEDAKLLDTLIGIGDATVSLVGSVALSLFDSIRKMVQTPPPGHSLINGEMNISLFEYKVTKFTFQSGSDSRGGFKYSVEADGLCPTTVVLRSRLHRMSDTYFLCRVWDRNVQRMIEVLASLMKSIFKEGFNRIKEDINDATEGLVDKLNHHHILSGSYELVDDTWDVQEAPENSDVSEKCSGQEDDQSDDKDKERAEKKAQELKEKEDRQKRELENFFRAPFSAYLVRLYQDQRVRVHTVQRVEACFPKKTFGFSKSATPRRII